MNTVRIRRGINLVALLSLVVPMTAAAAVPDKLPGDTILYIGWPGCAELKKTFGDTAMAKLMAEPQMQPLRNNLLPAIDVMIKGQLKTNDAEAYSRAKTLLAALYKYPAGLALVRVEAASVIPMIDAGLIVEAGDDAANLARSIDIMLEQSEATRWVKTVKVGPWTMKQFEVMGPNMALRWGVVGKDLVVTFGNKILRKLVPAFLPATATTTATGDDPAEDESPKSIEKASVPASLAENSTFIKALAATHATAGSPIIFINLKSVIHSLETFQPMMAAMQIPVLGEEGGVQRLLKEAGIENMESFSVAWSADGQALQSTTFFHCPGIHISVKPLKDEDFAVIPKGASWAGACNTDLVATYKRIMSVLQVVSPTVGAQVTGAIAASEERLGMSVEKDLLGSFDDTFVIYDEPENGSLLFTGITLIAKVKADARIDDVMRKLVAMLDDMIHGRKEVTVREEEYRGQKIAYVNCMGFPIPCAPAWTTCQGKWVAALFPQMVRVAVDRILDKGPSLLDNEGFRRGWKRMPAGANSMSYCDAGRSMRHVYSFSLPVADALIAMGQKEGLNLDAALLPSLTVINKHLFDSVAAGAFTPDGYVMVSQDAVPSLGAGASIAPVALATSITLPSLARARELSRQAARASNLRAIGTVCLAYAETHQGNLPADLEVLIESKMISQKSLIAPADCDSGDEGSYIYLGSGLTNKANPPGQIVLAHEKTILNNGQGVNVLFLDGHVQFMDLSALNKALKQSRILLKQQDENKEEGEQVPASEGAEQNKVQEAKE